jgi:hypothetical protein
MVFFWDGSLDAIFALRGLEVRLERIEARIGADNRE